MQLHPFLATVSRPVYHDGRGYLYLDIECPECGGEGTIECSSLGLAHPSSRSVSEPCSCCNGVGRVYEEVAEDDINPAQENAQ